MTNCPVTVRVKIAAHEGKQDAIFKCARRKWAIIRSLGPVGVVKGGGGSGFQVTGMIEGFSNFPIRNFSLPIPLPCSLPPNPQTLSTPNF